MSQTNRTLGELLRHHRLEASLTQKQLADLLDYDHSVVSRYERNERQPTETYLQTFIDKIHSLTEQAAEIWLLFNGEMDLQNSWGTAPNVAKFYGRDDELRNLEVVIQKDQCRVVAILGIGGLGKSALATKLGHQLKAHFDCIIWRSLQNAPDPSDFLNDLISLLASHKELNPQANIDDQLAALGTLFQELKCLLILDSVDTILEVETRAGQFIAGYEAYSRLIKQIGSTTHQSCLILTTRELPREILELGRANLPVQSFSLAGINEAVGQKLIQDKTLTGSPKDWERLINRYSGNPLALKIVAETISIYFNQNIATFLNENIGPFDNWRTMLDLQFERLTTTEQTVLYWLAIERQAATFQHLRTHLSPAIASTKIIEALQSLSQRALIEMERQVDSKFTLQTVILEYITDRLLETIEAQIKAGSVDFLHQYSLVLTQSSDYIRKSQQRHLLTPLTEKLVSTSGKAGVEAQLNMLLQQIHNDPNRPQFSYAAGNIFNLFVALGCNLSGKDFSGLTVWHARLDKIPLYDVNFSRADLAYSSLIDLFGGILSVSISEDKTRMAAATTDDEIRIWDFTSGKPLVTCRGHTRWIRAVAFSPKTGVLASASSDHTVRIWNTETGECLHVLQGHTNRVRTLAFSPNGQHLASAGDDNLICIWNVDEAICLQTLEGHEDSIRSVAFSPLDNNTLVSGGEDRHLYIWDIVSAKIVRKLSNHTKAIEAVGFQRQGGVVASGSSDYTIQLWDTQTGFPLATLADHTDRVRTIALSPTEDRLASGSYDQTIKIWHTGTGQLLKTLTGHTNWVRSVAFSRDGRTLISGSDDQTVRIWDIETGRCLKVLAGYTNPVWSAKFSPNGHYLASASEDQLIRLWDLNTGQCLHRWQNHNHRVTAIQFNTEGTICASGSNDRTIHLWDVAQGTFIGELTGHQKRITDIVFHRQGQFLFSSSSDCTIRKWNVETGQCTQVLLGHENRIWAIALNPDETWLASGSDDQTIRLWDTKSGQLHQTLLGHNDRIYAVAFNPNGQTLASAGNDTTIKLWNIKTGECIQTIQAHANRIWAVTYSPNGKTLASCSEDRTICLWDSQTGQHLQTFTGHDNRIRSLDFSLNGQYLASSSDDETIRIWDIQAKQCIKILQDKRPYEQMNIANVVGLTPAQTEALKKLGAVEDITFG